MERFMRIVTISISQYPHLAGFDCNACQAFPKPLVRRVRANPGLSKLDSRWLVRSYQEPALHATVDFLLKSQRALRGCRLPSVCQHASTCAHFDHVLVACSIYQLLEAKIGDRSFQRRGVLGEIDLARLTSEPLVASISSKLQMLISPDSVMSRKNAISSHVLGMEKWVDVAVVTRPVRWFGEINSIRQMGTIDIRSENHQIVYPRSVEARRDIMSPGKSVVIAIRRTSVTANGAGERAAINDEVTRPSHLADKGNLLPLDKLLSETVPLLMQEKPILVVTTKAWQTMFGELLLH
ncbi:uncharacterized protein BDR25DRAFT_348313 [Lindgomyces ingoldianus]|uniref:Uncharacterized protein n=1 Tax=Lindgomyces ingoldianus TaxID=673940 RepID=A0ACB6RI81_9PLEO|nr:uncharacterized protein BDR25DRAFT_348313 [Lindgomyces ingoldianus]KAF2478027.1 hypothetical protein BDR25DRAFT_348313 [Lindgomyces ingoldianus]